MKVIHRPFVYLDCPFTGDKIGVDKSIAPLIDLIWKAGIETTESCIRHGIFNKPCTHRTWIVFRGRPDVELFMKMIVSQLGPGDDLLTRISGYPGRDVDQDDTIRCYGEDWIFEARIPGDDEEFAQIVQKLAKCGNPWDVPADVHAEAFSKFEDEYLYRDGKLEAVGISDPKFSRPISVWFPLADFKRVLELFKAAAMER